MAAGELVVASIAAVEGCSVLGFVESHAVIGTAVALWKRPVVFFHDDVGADVALGAGREVAVMLAGGLEDGTLTQLRADGDPTLIFVGWARRWSGHG